MEHTAEKEKTNDATTRFPRFQGAFNALLMTCEPQGFTGLLVGGAVFRSVRSGKGIKHSTAYTAQHVSWFAVSMMPPSIQTPCILITKATQTRIHYYCVNFHPTGGLYPTGLSEAL
jgi:hypothetical protein